MTFYSNDEENRWSFVVNGKIYSFRMAPWLAGTFITIYEEQNIRASIGSWSGLLSCGLNLFLFNEISWRTSNVVGTSQLLRRRSRKRRGRNYVGRWRWRWPWWCDDVYVIVRKYRTHIHCVMTILSIATPRHISPVILNDISSTLYLITIRKTDFSCFI